MVVTDQIAALRALGTDPIRKLVVPRVLAGAAHGAAPDGHRRRRRHGRRLDRDGDCSSTSRRSVYWSSVVAGLYIQDVWMGLIKPFFLGFTIVTHRLPRRAADDGRHAGRRPGHDELPSWRARWR